MNAAESNAPPATATDRRVLLHACCGPCASHCVQELRRQRFEPTLLYANDNIATPAEFDRRLESLATLARIVSVPLVVSEYRHSDWLAAVRGCESEGEGGARCSACFRHNLTLAARHAAGHGLARFTTSLSVSPHKRSAQVFAAGETAAEASSAAGSFLPIDFKKQHGFLKSVALARDYGLYRQAHCGCEFSLRT